MVAIAGDTMAKRTDTAVKMDAEVVRKAKIVAAYREQTLAEFLSETLGQIIDDLLDKEAEKEKKSKVKKGSK